MVGGSGRRLMALVAAVTCQVLAAAAAGKVEVVMVTHNVAQGGATHGVWTVMVNKEYARRHGYTFLMATDTSKQLVGSERDPRWSKVRILQDLISAKGNAEGMTVVNQGAAPEEGAQRVYFWMDDDTVLFNFGRRLESLLEGHDEHSLIVNSDSSKRPPTHQDATAATFFLRENEWADTFLSAWWKEGSKRAETLFGEGLEEGALRRLFDQKWAQERAAVVLGGTFSTVVPFYENTEASSMVLHMGGEPYGGLKYKIFYSVWEALSGSGKAATIKTPAVIDKFCGWADDGYRIAMGDFIVQTTDTGRKVFGSQPSDADLLTRQANLQVFCRGMRGVPESVSLLKRAAELAPLDPQAHLRLAERMMQHVDLYGRGNLTAVQEHVKAALRLPGSPPEMVQQLLDLDHRAQASRASLSEKQPPPLANVSSPQGPLPFPQALVINTLDCCTVMFGGAAVCCALFLLMGYYLVKTDDANEKRVLARARSLSRKASINNGADPNSQSLLSAQRANWKSCSLDTFSAETLKACLPALTDPEDYRPTGNAPASAHYTPRLAKAEPLKPETGRWGWLWLGTTPSSSFSLDEKTADARAPDMDVTVVESCERPATTGTAGRRRKVGGFGTRLPPTKEVLTPLGSPIEAVRHH